ncbi:hypothetical protein ES703_100779 [subsurface metagenome]
MNYPAKMFYVTARTSRNAHTSFIGRLRVIGGLAGLLPLPVPSHDTPPSTGTGEVGHMDNPHPFEPQGLGAGRPPIHQNRQLKRGERANALNAPRTFVTKLYHQKP